MTQAQPVLALIPARGGSKGVPRKNLALVAGKSLLEYTIDAARNSRMVEHCFVSSDDPEILDVASRRGARALRRPAQFATDDASAVDVVRHFLAEIHAEFPTGNPLIVYLQPTSPLRGAAHVDQALKTLHAQGGSTLMSVVELEKSPYKAFGIGGDGRLQSLFDERLSNARRQDLPRAYVPNGAIYVFSREDFLARDGFPSNGSIPFVMNAEESIDVDVPDDIQRVAKLIGEKHG